MIDLFIFGQQQENIVKWNVEKFDWILIAYQTKILA